MMNPAEVVKKLEELGGTCAACNANFETTFALYKATLQSGDEVGAQFHRDNMHTLIDRSLDATAEMVRLARSIGAL